MAAVFFDSIMTIVSEKLMAVKCKTILIRILGLLIIFSNICYTQVTHDELIPLPTSLDRLALVVDVTDTNEQDPALHTPKTHGQLTTYFSSLELFYDATMLSGWHFVMDYSIKRGNVDNSLIISTKLPASRSNSDLLTFRQTLIFSNKFSGDTLIEFYDKGKPALTYKGKFVIKSQELLINSDGLKDRNFSLKVEAITKDSTLFPQRIGNKIDIHFVSEKEIQFSINGAKYIGKNEYVKQTYLSTVSLHGSFNGGNTYDVSLNYYDFNKGIMQIGFEDNARLSGSFETHRYTAISPTPLKGEMIRGGSFYSQHTGITYPYEIYLPPGYATSKRNYPVVYITDGQWVTDLANIIDSNNKSTILVFIDQGPDDRRAIDYQPVGADAYIKFLKQELVPFIESRYRVNGTRSFFGTSLGGLLGGILISQEVDKPFFKNYILADASFWGITPEIISAEALHYTENHKLPINILLTGSLRGNAVDVANYEQRFRKRNYEGINIINKTLPYLHDEMAGPTLTTFIRFIDL